MESDNRYLMRIYDLPYEPRRDLCRLLDLHDKWEELGGVYMNINVLTLQYMRRSPSPTDELLTHWGSRNHTVLELFALLSKMQNYQAMMILKPLINPKYHRLIYEGEQNLSTLFQNNTTHENPESSSARRSNYTPTAPCLIPSGKDLGINPNNLNSNEAAGRTHRSLRDPLAGILEDFLSQKVMNTIAQNHNPHIAVTSGNNNANIVAADNESHNQPRPPPSQSRKLSSVSTASATSDSGLPLVNYSELEAATNRWDRTCILGRGGFGTVYKGSWKNTLVAIKKLETQKANMLVSTELLEAQRQQSLRELKYLNSCRHDNILPLYGYSVGGEASCLVYQFMINGSLEDRLMCRQDSKPINWLQRHRIATGTACGLQFLHSVGDKPLVHGDIKSANILLDSHLEPRIGDFGLAREGPLQQYTHVKVSRVHGTRPYLPDEFLRGKKFSTKVDTFSFGIVLFELATGLRAYEENRHHKYLKDHVEETDLPELADPKAGPDNYAVVQSLLNLGKWCTKTLAKNRPDMVIVLQTLNSLPRDVNILNQNSPPHSNNEMQQNRECVSPGPKKLSPSTQKLSASPNQTPVHMKTKQTPVALQIPVPIINPPPTHRLLTPPEFGNASVSPRSVSPNTPVQQLPTEMTVPPSFSPNFPDLFMQKSEVDASIPSIVDAIGSINVGNNRLNASPAPCDDLPLMTELGIKPLENDQNNIT